MTMIEIKRNQMSAGISQIANVYMGVSVTKSTKIPALSIKKRGICEKVDCDLGHPVFCNRLTRVGGCTLRLCFYFHPENSQHSRDIQNGSYRNNNYKNPKNFRFSRKPRECRFVRYNDIQTPRYNYRRPSYRPHDHQSYPNNIKITDSNNSNKDFLGTQLSPKEIQIIQALGKIIINQKD